MKKRISFNPFIFGLHLSLLLIFVSKVNAQCDHTISTFFDYNDFRFFLDLDNPSQVVLEVGACEPCLWWDETNGLFPDGPEICHCREDCDEEYENWLDNCIKHCNGGGCFGQCYSDALNMQDECYENCGDELPTPSDIVQWDLEIGLWWNTSHAQTISGPADDYWYKNSFITPGPLPTKFELPTTTNLYSMTIYYCIYYYLHIEHDNGLCCNFTSTICFN